MKRLLLPLLLLLAVLGGACALLLPGGMAIRGPILNSMFGSGIDAPAPNVVKQRIQAAPGYEVALWAEGLPNARFMRFSPGGSLLLSQPRQGRILVVLPDEDGDGFSDGQRILIEGLDRPHGLDIAGGHLYIGEGSAIARVPIREAGPGKIEIAGEPTRIAEGIPEGGNHWTRTLRFGPDGRLYLHVGSSCNVCEEEDERRATLLRFEADGSGETIFASGLRNSVGFDWHPVTGELFATDNGRDLLGDDFPPCEFNRIVEGGFYGWPYANGDNIADPDFGDGHAAEIARAIPPVHGFRAHNAPLGMTFVRHPSTPAALQGAALVALHGSWNRTELDGYKVVSLHWNQNGDIEERDFLTGFLEDGDVIGRPVDVVESPSGDFFVSDDYGGALYRVSRADTATSGAKPLTRAIRDPKGPMAVDDPLAHYSASDRAQLGRQGEALFKQHACATCHREVAAGETPEIALKALRELGRRYTVDSLKAFFLAPQSPMPVFDLPDEEREALAVYLLERYGKAAPSR